MLRRALLLADHKRAFTQHGGASCWVTWRKLRDNFLKSWVGGARSLSRELEKAEGNRGGGNSGNGGIPFIAAGAEERKRRGEREGERREGRGEAMECSAGAAIE